MADLAFGTRIQPAALYGDTSRKDQASMLSGGFDILVATPRRLIDMLQWSYIDRVKTLSLEHLSRIIWDEVDELFLTEALGTEGVFYLWKDGGMALKCPYNCSKKQR